MVETKQTVAGSKPVTVLKGEKEKEKEKTVDSSAIEKSLEQTFKEKEGKSNGALIKEVIIKAAPTFVITPPEVESEAYIVIGCPLKGRNVYIPLEPKELAEVAQEVFGINDPKTAGDKVQKYFEEYRVKIEYANNEVGVEEDGKALKIPIDEDGKTVWNKHHVDDIILHRICLQSKKVAITPNEIEEARAPGESNFVAYVLDKGAQLLARRGLQKLRRNADIAFLKITDSGKERELNWITRIVLKGITVGNNVRFLPTKVGGDLSAMIKEDKQLILSELRDKYPKEFLSVIADPNLEMRSLVEQLIDLGILSRTGNVIKYGDEVLGTNVNETIDELKKPTRSNLIVELKAASKIE